MRFLEGLLRATFCDTSIGVGDNFSRTCSQKFNLHCIIFLVKFTKGMHNVVCEAPYSWSHSHKNWRLMCRNKLSKEPTTSKYFRSYTHIATHKGSIATACGVLDNRLRIMVTMNPHFEIRQRKARACLIHSS